MIAKRTMYYVIYPIILITFILWRVSVLCFAGEQEELQLKEVYYQKCIQCAQYEIALSQNELKLVQGRLEVLKRQAEEANKTEKEKARK